VAGTLLWVIGALTAGGLALSYAFRQSVDAAFDERLNALLLALVAATEVAPTGEVTIGRPLPEPRFAQVYSGWYWQIDENDRPLLRSRSLWDESLPAADPAAATIAGPRGQRLRIASQDVTWPTRSLPLRLRLAVNEEEMLAETSRFNRLLAVSLGVLGIGLAVAVLVQVRFGLRPVRQVAGDLARIRSGDLARLPGGYPAEIEPLADALNDVLDHDATLIERARTHVGNLAHALKTPLAILKAELRPTGRASDVADAQLAVMADLIQHHLSRAAAAGPARGSVSHTEVAPVVRAVRDGLARIHAERRLAIDVDIEADARFRGERQDLEEMLGNLMDNACQWAATRVRVSTVADAALCIDVDDDGPGVAPEGVAAALERGVRLNGDRPGSGLGLAIARDLAELYGGSLVLTDSSLGGLRARLSLPGTLVAGR
jgi:signal transduction histidine kinase